MYQKQFYLFFVTQFAHRVKLTLSETECINGKYYAHPNNCRLFYQCSVAVLIEQSCPDGLYFNPNTDVCDWPENVTCEIYPSTVTTPIKETTTTEQKREDECGCVSNSATELATLFSQVKGIEEKAIAIELKSLQLETLSIELDIRTSQIEAKSDQLEAKLTELDNLINYLTKNAVTNIRLVDPQQADVWLGPGYADTSGWVITGTVNWNEDEYLDTINRRRIEKLVNGQWVAV